MAGGFTLLMVACGGTAPSTVEDEVLPNVEFAHPEYILSAGEVLELVNQADEDESVDLVILDARSASDFRSDHIVGAVHLPPRRLDRDEGDYDFQVRSAEEMAPLLQEAGINHSSQIVIYDSGGTYNAARVWWILDYYGHPNKAVLDGGYVAWQAVSDEATAFDIGAAATGDFVPVADPEKIADYQYVLDHLGSDATSVCDARRAGDYAEGAVPGAVSLPYSETFADRSVMTKDAAQLQDMFLAVGLEPEEEIIFYCIGGYLSSQDYLLARALGYENVRLYDGSILEWNQREGPTEPGRAR
jgi:thiosulfate/3-mercaptopyruvate sulfurtransferase